MKQDKDLYHKLVRVSTYDLKPNWDITFPDRDTAMKAIEDANCRVYNLYVLVNGIWTTEY